MNEHLFKLKNDEKKTVGYLLLKCGAIFWKSRYECDEWTCNQEFAFEWATAHPFVTKDKNGKDVFADDKIKGLYFWPDAKKPQTITGKVGWRDETLNWVLYHTPNTPECADLWQLQNIELIEEKEDE